MHIEKDRHLAVFAYLRYYRRTVPEGLRKTAHILSHDARCHIPEMKNTKQEFQLLGENFRFVYEVSGCDGVEYTMIFWIMTSCSLVAMYLHFALPAAYIFRPEEKSELRNYAYFSFYCCIYFIFSSNPFFLLHNSSPFHPLTKEPLLGPQAVFRF